MRKGSTAHKERTVTSHALILSGLLLLGNACAPKVELGGSDKPITINMNVKIDHEVRVKVDKDLESVISENSDLF